MSRSRLYFIIIIACTAGWMWLGYTSSASSRNASAHTELCLMKKVTGVPCPSCGSTRAVHALMDGNLGYSIRLNPLGLILFTIMTASPFWVFIDFLRNNDSFMNFYKWIERKLKTKWIAITCILLLLANWAWNISKFH